MSIEEQLREAKENLDKTHEILVSILESYGIKTESTRDEASETTDVLWETT